MGNAGFLQLHLPQGGCCTSPSGLLTLILTSLTLAQASEVAFQLGVFASSVSPPIPASDQLAAQEPFKNTALNKTHLCSTAFWGSPLPIEQNPHLCGPGYVSSSLPPLPMFSSSASANPESITCTVTVPSAPAAGIAALTPFGPLLKLQSHLQLPSSPEGASPCCPCRI